MSRQRVGLMHIGPADEDSSTLVSDKDSMESSKNVYRITLTQTVINYQFINQIREAQVSSSPLSLRILLSLGPLSPHDQAKNSEIHFKEYSLFHWHGKPK